MACTGHVNLTSCAGHNNNPCIGHNAAVCAGHVATACHSHVTTACNAHVTTHPCTTHSTTACAEHVGVVSGGEATIFEDVPLTSDNKIRAIHTIELMNAIQDEYWRREFAACPSNAGNVITWTFNTASINTGTKVHRQTIKDLRNALNEAETWINMPAVLQDAYIDSNLINKDQFVALRNQVNNLETLCACNCNYACTCQCNYVCTCNCNYACTCVCNYTCTCLCNYACTCQCNYVCTCNCNYACTCQCNYACTCNCNYACTCNCNYACTCNCNYACTCNCNYTCTCNCAYSVYSDSRLKTDILYL